MKRRFNLFYQIAVFLLLSCRGLSQPASITFQHLDIESGLSQSNVLCMLQDSKGFMWFGTRDGLNKYDGYRFTTFKKDPDDSTGLVDDFINCIFEDSKGNIWIATWGGLSRFNSHTNRFTNFVHNDKKRNSLASNLVNFVMEDSEHYIWLGTDDKGVDRYDPVKNEFIHFRYSSVSAATLSNNLVRDIYEDSRRNLWIATDGGLNLFNRKTQTFTRFMHDDRQKNSITHNSLYDIFEDSRNNLWIGTNGGGFDLMNREMQTFIHFKQDKKNPDGLNNNAIYALGEDDEGNIWVGTENGGLNIYNPRTGIFKKFLHDEVDHASISNNSIYSILKDKKGNMWVGTFLGGVNIMNKDGTKFLHYKHTSAKNSLSDNNVLSIFEDSKGRMWIGTDGGGINLFDRQGNHFTHFKHQDGNANSICGDYILSIAEDGKGNLWFGTWGDGITVYNPEKNSYTHYKNDPLDETTLSGNNAWGIYEDRKGNMWVATYGGGLNLFDPDTRSFKRYMYDAQEPEGINTNRLYCLFDDGMGKLWIGTDGGGLNAFDMRSQKFTHFLHDQSRKSLSNNAITGIFPDRYNNFWLATIDGLNYYNRKTGEFTVYTVKDGLPNNTIFGLLDDDHGNLWISTSQGLSKFNVATKKFRNFNVSDGLQSNEFKEQAFCKSRTGEMFFGGINGFNAFYPDRIREIHFDPPLVFTNFQLFNKDVTVAGNEHPDSPLKQDISETKDLTLSYKHSVISFEFASLNYTIREKKRYLYQLEGFDQGWTHAPYRRSATYTNLDPGHYVFKVRGMTNDGKWSDKVASIDITITPPFWLTWWFKLLAAIAVVGGTLAIFRMRMQGIKKQKKELERQVAERTESLVLLSQQERLAREEAEQANKAKSTFLATMSHEIRTPMNGVLGMATLLSQTQLNDQQAEYAHIIRNCGESLLNVINDILDFSKIESGKIELENAGFDLRSCIEDVLDLFAGKAAETDLDLIYQIDHNVPSNIMGDRLRLRQVLMNLVSNAIKFTTHGEIYVGVKLSKSGYNNAELQFEVRDTGIGIPKEKIGRLFKAFSQVDSSTTRKYGGTGLGLVICEKLVKLMGGHIHVESQPGLGTTFFFTINAGISTQPVITYINQNTAGLADKKILVVDDNSTNLVILKNQLELWKMKPVLARSGSEALEILSLDDQFDLVITDMQMPGMDGMELAGRIRKQLASIPMILLSSVCHNNNNLKVEVFASILIKPIKQHILCDHILSILCRQQRQAPEKWNQKEKFSKEFAQLNPLRILIAEDNLINQQLAVQILKNLGYEPAVANNGVEVLDLLQTNSYNLILMDVQMPEMDGLEATRKIKDLPGEQPVIVAMTANAIQGDREECLQAGMDDYISKPVDINLLIKILENWASSLKARA